MNNEELTHEQKKQKIIDAYEAARANGEQEPDASPTTKKEFIVGCYTAEDWVEIHALLTSEDTSEDNVPSESIPCCNETLHSPKRGIYSLTDPEAEALRDHPKVEYVNVNAAKYPGTFAVNPLEVTELNLTDGRFYRYDNTVKHQKAISTSGIRPTNPGVDLLNRGSWQLHRHTQAVDPWLSASSTSSIIETRHQQLGDGSDVDIIVCDQDMWFGHIEFQNNLETGPTRYRGGNVLPGNGTCDILDLILDAPYYLDPDFFDADPAQRLMTRWDGTIVPTETAAHNWWENNSTSYRSEKFVSQSQGGSASGVFDFGQIMINSGYTRANSNGSNNSYHTGAGYHGTPCASQSYGRQYGWAFNANKWFLNLYGTNSHTFEVGFDLQKVFHNCKPNNPTYGTKDPTVSSNSWSNRFTPASSGYYWHRPATIDGTTPGVSYSSKPAFMNNYNSNTRAAPYAPNSVLTAGEEMIDAGVIFVCAAGNRHQLNVPSDDVDFNNYDGSSSTISLENSKSTSYYGNGMYGLQYYRTHNRIGFPGQIGVQTSTTPWTYRTINVGALDDLHSNNKERLVYYTNRGPGVDVYATSDYSLAASDDNYPGTITNRYDRYYTIDGTQSVESRDCLFNGTSSACPIFVGILATKLQYNRSWTYADCKTWINSITPQSTSDFNYIARPDTPTHSNWSAQNDAWEPSNTLIVAWDKPTGNEPGVTFEQDFLNTPTPNLPSVIEGTTLSVSITTDASDGTYYYSCEKDDFGSNIEGSDFQSLSLTGSFTVASGTGTIDIPIKSGILSNNQTESFRFRIRTGSTTGPIVATSQDFQITDAPEPNPFVFATGEGLSFSGSISIRFE